MRKQAILGPKLKLQHHSPLRLLSDQPLPGAVNMTRDEALLTRVGEGVSPATLRLYQWAAPTVSLGYFQRFAEYEALPPPAGGLAVVRRLTGGGAILHDLELTYSLALPIDHRLLSEGHNRIYEFAHDAVRAALLELGVRAEACGRSDDSTPTRGPFFCFARRHCFDVVLDQDKLAGSAQRRTRRAVLQHGSIILASRFDQQPSARFEAEYGVALAHVRAAFPRALSNITGESNSEGAWSPEELHAAEGLLLKYAGVEWTRRA